jgi:hypothetical protein
MRQFEDLICAVALHRGGVVCGVALFFSKKKKEKREKSTQCDIIIGLFDIHQSQIYHQYHGSFQLSTTSARMIVPR